MCIRDSSGKEDSEALSYNAVPKSVSAEQWALIAGADYQFHIQYTLADYLRTNSYSAVSYTHLDLAVVDRDAGRPVDGNDEVIVAPLFFIRHVPQVVAERSDRLLYERADGFGGVFSGRHGGVFPSFGGNAHRRANLP